MHHRYTYFLRRKALRKLCLLLVVFNHRHTTCFHSWRWRRQQKLLLWTSWWKILFVHFKNVILISVVDDRGRSLMTETFTWIWKQNIIEYEKMNFAKVLMRFRPVTKNAKHFIFLQQNKVSFLTNILLRRELNIKTFRYLFILNTAFTRIPAPDVGKCNVSHVSYCLS